MATASIRQQTESTVRALASVGVFHKSTVSPHLTVGEVGEIVDECGVDAIDTVDGWTVVLSSSTLVGVTLRRIAGALGDEPSLCRVPRHEVVLAITKAIDHAFPQLSEHYETLPQERALDTLFYLTGCRVDRDWVDFSTVTDWIAVKEGHEALILDELKRSIDCNMAYAKMLRPIGMSGNRTTFKTKVLPSVPFVLGGYKNEPVRLLGQRPSPARLKQRETGTYLGLAASECGNRLLVTYRLTDEALQTSSFHIPQDAKRAVAGEYYEERSGMTISFNINTKHARKLAGLRSAVLRLYPDYVAGQHVYLLLDKVAGTAHVEVLNAIDYEGQDRVREMLDTPPTGPGLAA